MKRSIVGLVLVLLIVASLAVAQEYRMKPENHDRFKKLHSYRIWLVIEALELDAKTDKGAAVLSLLNSHADKNREVILAIQGLKAEISELLKQKSPDEENISVAVTGLEDKKIELATMESVFISDLRELLTPLQRAKFIAAEEEFRNSLRKAMRRRTKSSKRHY